MSSKLREALSDACYAMFNFLKTQNGGYEEMAIALDKAKSALAEPVRNCDVGTVDEQLDRYGLFCQNECPVCEERHSCHICGERYRMKCMAAWAQMPYEEGGSK